MKIHSFESLAALDGQGLRYGVFFCGCPLRCVYCHNPDTWFNEGSEYTPEALSKKIRRYKPYFKDNGGVTFSGGEPLLSAEYINQTNVYLKRDGINYALDTSGCVDLTDEVKKAVMGADLVILDLKFYDSESYEKYAKGDFDKIMKFFDYLGEINKRTWVRTVIVPGINDNEESIKKYKEILKGRDYVEKYKLLAFHTMGFFKYEKLEIENPLKDTPAMDKDKLAKLQEIADM